MKAFFNFVTSLTLRFRAITITLVFVLLVAGVVAVNQLNQELLPPIDLPQTIILAQASGMDGDQVLNVFTERLEPQISDIEDIINIESTTSGAFGTVITAFNDFGLDQERLRDELRATLNEVWFPLRTITPPEGEDPQAFAASLFSDMPPELALYLAQVDSNFLFQLSPEVWALLPDETVNAVLAYLADQTDQSETNRSALQRLVDKEVVPQLNAIADVANVAVAGGQALPGDESSLTVDPDAVQDEEAISLLLRLSPDVWDVVSDRVDGVDTLDDSAVDALSSVDYDLPATPPALPESWQFEHFSDASDLIEIATISTPIATLLNDFADTGVMRGALGQTNDLTPETVNRMLEIDPTLVQYFDAEHLVAMSQDVFQTLPDDYIANLDGFTRDALAAASLAESITGEDAQRTPVDLPGPWRIQPPQIITFSFADIPLATFSVSTSGGVSDLADDVVQDADAESNETVDETTADGEDAGAVEAASSFDDVPEGPELPPIFALIGGGLGIELDTADDLLAIQLPEEFAALIGTSTASAADLLNLLTLPAPDPETLPEGVEVPQIPIDPAVLVGSLSPEVFGFIAENDPSFISSLAPQVYNFFSDAVLEEFAPPLDDAWNVLAGQPQFADMPLVTAADVVEIGDGEPSSVLNAINEAVPQRFEGYEVRLFDSLSPAVVRYFALNEDDFYQNLDVEVVNKFAPDVLSILPESFLDTLDEGLVEELNAIADGEAESAFAQLEAELYTTDVPPADPSAPALNPEWQTIAGFVAGVREFNNAFDLFRFSDAIGTPAEFINSLFESANGRGFAPDLLGNMDIEAVDYIRDNDADFLNQLNVEAINLFSDDVRATFPDDVIERAEQGGERFTPDGQVTRTNRSPSLLVTVFKTQDSNTVSAYAEVEAAMNAIDTANDNIVVDVAFEQSSFIEDSISGVAREGSLGAVFAVIIILVFLSGGVWIASRRRVTGIVMLVVFAGGLALLLFAGIEDIVILVLFGVGLAAAIGVLAWPGDLPDPAWRATLVIGVSIPLSILTAFVGMRWVSPAIHELISPLAADSEFFSFVLRLFPDSLTLNIMTLSGLTVAVGRVVDDSIVVLENIFRQLQSGEDKKSAVLSGTRDVSSAIFVATTIAVVVFLPLGLTGGIIGAFFLPFGLAVTYALIGSFIVAITVVPVLAFVFLSVDDLPEESDIWLASYYVPVLKWALANWRNRAIVLFLAFLSLVFSGFLFGQRPVAFLPAFGEPQITVAVDLPPATSIIDTNDRVEQLEQFITDEISEEELGTVQTTIGGSGLDFEALLTGGSVQENRAAITIGIDSSGDLDQRTQQIRDRANEIFGVENVIVSAASVADGGFGGFALVVSGIPDDIDERIALDQRIIETLNGVEGIANVSSNLSEAAAGGADSETFIRVNQETAISYSAEIETEDTIGVTQIAIETIESLPDLPEEIVVSQGFESELQTEGIQSLILAIGIASIIVVVILVLTFGSLVYWFAIFLSVIVAPVGAAIALTLTDRVLGISALIGILMLLGLVITNAVVLIDRVRSNRTERGMTLYDALIEAGGRRLRPILMTSLATIIALMPLTIGLSEGAIIAAELGTVVVGGVFSSTLLTLIVVPVMYSLLYPVHRFLAGLIGVKAD